MPSASEPPDLVARLLRRDRAAFREAIALCGPAMLRAARAITKNDSSAEEVVQEAWLAIVKALPRFEGRSSLRTWAVTITVNKARTRLAKDAREVPTDADDTDTLVGAGAFNAAGWWTAHPGWMRHALDHLEQAERLACVKDALAAMPPLQAAVLTLHDLEGAEPVEICNALEISESNQRVLLHRARARVRQAWLARLESRPASAGAKAGSTS